MIRIHFSFVICCIYMSLISYHISHCTQIPCQGLLIREIIEKKSKIKICTKTQKILKTNELQFSTIFFILYIYIFNFFQKTPRWKNWLSGNIIWRKGLFCFSWFDVFFLLLWFFSILDSIQIYPLRFKTSGQIASFSNSFWFFIAKQTHGIDTEYSVKKHLI